MLLVKKEPKACSACGLCMTVCQKDAISMKQGDDGFLYPQIDEGRCSSCGACQSICPFGKTAFVDERAEKTELAYAYKHLSSVRAVSSSGGFFTALSDYVLSKNGVVYGAVFADDFKVVHIRAESISERDRMRGSKYVQSDMSEVYKTIREDVGSGRLVLFSGTPCECAALIRHLGTSRPQNLIIIDLICHGVMSYDFFRKYLEGICPSGNVGALKSFNFRDKRFGWQAVSAEIEGNDFYHSSEDYFYKIYGTQSLQRSSCFSCTFSCEKRFGDFTVGDYWGIKKHHPDFYANDGVSLVLVNTELGKELISELPGERIELRKNEYFDYQPNLSHPTEYGDRAKKILKYYRKHGYTKTMHRFFDVTWRRRLNRGIGKILKRLHLK